MTEPLAHRIIRLLGVDAERLEDLAARIAARGGDPRDACEAEATTATLTEAGWLVSPAGASEAAAMYGAAALVAARAGAAAESESLFHDAAFILGRDAMRHATAEAARRKRSADGALGGRPRDKWVSDEQVRAAWEAQLRRNGGAQHGALGPTANRLGIDVTTLSKRLEVLGLRVRVQKRRK